MNAIHGVSFIVPTWNQKEMILKCIKSLDACLSVECPKIQKEIIVIENGSIDGSFEALLKCKTKMPLITVKQNNNIGFARAINLGMNIAKYDYAYLLNNDMEVQFGFFEQIIDAANHLINKRINFFGISSQIYFYDPSVFRQESGLTLTRFSHGRLFVYHELNPSKLKKITATAYPGGGSSLINKQIFNQLGGYNHEVYTPLYCEDLDIGFVAWQKGYPSFFCPTSKVLHHHRSSTKLLSVNPDEIIQKNYLAFCIKNFQSIRLMFELLIFYPIYLIFKKNYWIYLMTNIKNIKNICKSRKKLKAFPDIYKDIDLINFKDFVKEYSKIYETN